VFKYPGGLEMFNKLKKLLLLSFGLLLASQSSPAATLSLAVNDASTSAPVAGAAIFLQNSPADSLFTDDNGQAFVSDLDPGDYILGVFHSEYIPFFLDRLVIEAGDNSLTVSLEPFSGGGAASLSGMVTNAETGLGISEAGIMIEPMDMIWFTDENGDYHIDGLAEGENSIFFMHPQFQELFIPDLQLVAGENQLDVQLQEAVNDTTGLAALSGFVFGQEGNVLAGVTVSIEQMGFMQISISDDNGIYSFENLFAGPSLITASTPDGLLYSSWIELLAGENQLDIHFLDDPVVATLIISVIDEITRLPLADVEVTVDPFDMVFTTDENGMIEVSGFPELFTIVYANHPLYMPAWSEMQLQPGINFLTIAMLALNQEIDAELGGMVYLEDGTALANVNLVVNTGNGEFLTISAEDGSYNFDNLLAGYAMLTAFTEDGLQQTDQIMLNAGYNHWDVILGHDLPEAASLSGIVYMEENLPAPGMTVQIWQFGWFETTVTDDTGNYEFVDLQTGPAEIAIWAPDGRPLYMAELNLLPDANVHDIYIDDQGQGTESHVSGVVLDLISREPITAAQLTIMNNENPGDIWETSSDDQGNFDFGLLSSNAFALFMMAQNDNYEDYLTEINFGYDDSIFVEVLMVPLFQEDLGAISGSVTVEGSDQHAMAVVELIGAGDTPGWGYFATTEPDGSYEISAPAGEYYVSCMIYRDNPNGGWDYLEFYDNSQDLENATIVVVIENEVTTDIDFELPLMTNLIDVSLSGRITNLDGENLAGAIIRFWEENGELIDEAVISGPNGLWEATLNDRLPIVPFTISAEHDGNLLEFFSDAVSFNTATIFEFGGDVTMTNVDFQLDPVMSGIFSVSGNLSDTNGDGLGHSLVAALDPEGQYLTTVSTDINGDYSFNNLNAGDIMLLYYTPGQTPVFSGGVYNQENADLIDVENADTMYNHVIDNNDHPSGPCQLAGVVDDADSNPVFGALVIAQNDLSGVSHYAFTGQNGEFIVSGMADNSTFTVTVNMAGFATHEAVAVTNTYQQYTLNTQYALESLTAVEEEVLKIPVSIELSQNYPNPFNPETVISYSLPVNAQVSLNVYNLIGERVAVLVNDFQTRGNYNISFNADDLSSGVYIYSLQTGDTQINRRMLLIK
jgi:hypothetical protein